MNARASAGRVPPNAVASEQCVLMAVLLERAHFDAVQGILTAEHFYDPRHRLIFEAVAELVATNRPVDSPLVASVLREKERLEQAGGAAYLGELTDWAPAVENVEEHARLVRDKWRARAVIARCQRAAAEGYADAGTGEQLDKWMTDVAADLDAIGRGEDQQTIWTMTELVRAEATAISERARNESAFSGIPTGITELDEMINGLKRGNKYEVAARPGIGKTGFMMSVGLHVAECGFGVILISVEMPKEQLTQRAISQVAMMDIKAIERGKLSAEQWSRYTNATKRLNGLPIAIDDAGSQTAQSIRSAVRRAKKRLEAERPGIKLALVAIDYLQLLKAQPDGTRGRNKANEVGEIARATKEMAKEFDCVVMELSQLNRELEKAGGDKRPNLSHLRDSGEIEETAFGVIMLYREDYYRKPDEPRDGTAEILVRKLRQGGETGMVRCQFHGPSTRFYNLPPEEMSLVDDEHDSYRG